MKTKEVQELFSKHEKEKQELFNSLLEEGKLSYKPRANKIETRDAYTNVLETGNKAREALAHVEEIHSKTDGWKDAVKNSPIPRQFVDYALNYHVDHPVTKCMASEGVLDKHSKRALKSAATLSSFLNTLSSQVRMTHDIMALKSAVRDLAARAVNTDNRLNALEDTIKVNKQKALQLLREGYSINHVAKLSGKHRNTVSRWKDKLTENLL